jgi:hypothetical protein
LSLSSEKRANSDKVRTLTLTFSHCCIQVKDRLFGEDWLKCFTAEILDAKYERMDVVEVLK